MVCAGSILKVTDNTGAKIVRCIRVLGKKFGEPGDRLVVSVREVYGGVEKIKVKKGEVYNAVLVRSKKEVGRHCGSFISFSDNAVVLVDKKGLPVGSRVLGPVAREVRVKGYKRVVALAMVTV